MSRELRRTKSRYAEAREERIQRLLERTRLINLIRANPILWDKKSPIYVNQRLTKNKIKIWTELAEQLGVSTEKARRTWDNLRDQYRRDLKRVIATGTPSKWCLFDEMNFIRSTVRVQGLESHSDSESDIELEECSIDNSSISDSHAPNTLHCSSQPTTSTATAATRKNINKTPTEFLPIQSNNDQKQREEFDKQLHQEGKQKTIPQLEFKLQQQPKLQISKISEIQQDHFDALPQHNCDSSKVHNYAKNDEVNDDENSDSSIVIKIEMESDSNDKNFSKVLKKQRQQERRFNTKLVNQSLAQVPPQKQQRQQQQPQQSLLQSQQSPPQHQTQQQQQQQLEELDLAREPRPSAPRPDIDRQSVSEQFVTTSEMAIKCPKRRLLTQSNTTTEDHFPSCYVSDRSIVASAVEAELQDEDYHFVMSILPSLRKVASKRKFPLRSQIMSLISKELEESNV